MHVQPVVSSIVSRTATTAALPVHHSLVPHWIVHLGLLGFFLVAVLDSSVIPLPIPGSTDLLLLWMVSQRGNPWLLASTAVVGSLVGGYTTWHLGRRGGEAALHRYVSARLLQPVTGWVQNHPILAVFLPAMLPPPIPLSPFVLASGALGVPRRRFLLAFGAARCLRYGLITWLGIAYGRRVVRLWSATLQKWSAPLLWTFATVVVCSISFGIWKMWKEGRLKSRPKQTAEATVGHAE